MSMDERNLEVYAGTFESLQAAEDFMRIVDGKPQRFYDELYLTGDFNGHIEIKFFDKKTNKAEELYKNFTYGDIIVEGLQVKYLNKLKRQVNTAIVIYDFNLGEHFSSHFLNQMKEKRTDKFYIFNVGNIYPYKEL